MEGEPPKPTSTPMVAVFLSYASQDAQAVQKICEALRVAGVEVWFDQAELRGGTGCVQPLAPSAKPERLQPGRADANNCRRTTRIGAPFTAD